jgi:hypothetical protein
MIEERPQGHFVSAGDSSYNSLLTTFTQGINSSSPAASRRPSPIWTFAHCWLACALHASSTSSSLGRESRHLPERSLKQPRRGSTPVPRSRRRATWRPPCKPQPPKSLAQPHWVTTTRRQSYQGHRSSPPPSSNFSFRFSDTQVIDMHQSKNCGFGSSST